MSEIQKYCFTALTKDGKACTNATLTPISHTGVDISCWNGLCVEFSLTEGAESHCITVQIDCHSCDCDPDIVTKCFCETSEDCPNSCEFCNSEGVCTSFCEEGQFCDDDVCVDCLEDGDCPCNQKCIQGKCACEDPGDVINPAGCCVECTNNADCGPCEVCDGGNCVPKDCGTGHCNPITGECHECYTNAHCGANECCIGGDCQCCPGFYRDPVTQLCVEIPDCFTSEDCKACEDCVNNNCVPTVCPEGQICINGTCVDGCEDPGDCPLGYGCLAGQCVKCETLSCSGNVSFCEQAAGCDCVNDICTYVDCTVLDDCVTWNVVRPVVIPGTPVPGSGQPAVAFTVSWQDLGLVTMSGGEGLFRDYRFTITESTGASGIFSTYGYTLGTGSTVSFNLSDATPIQWNNVAFEIEFQESPGSRTGSIAIANLNWFNPDPGGASESFFENLLTAPANWSVNVQANSVPPATSGGSVIPGSLTLCPCNPNAVITGWSWTTIEGNLTVTFSPLGDGCLRATVQGCGSGEGEVTVDCAGFVSTIPIPSLPFDYSGDCCDPITDPTCEGNPGEGTPCQVVDILQGDIVLSQFNYTTPSGAGLFRGVFQPDSIGMSIFDWVRAARTVCWSTTGTMTDASTFVPPALNFLFHDVEYTLGEGCLRMGYNCSIRVGVCKEVRAEACLSGCEAFVVNIFNDDGELTALTSLGNSVQLSYNWFTNSSPSVSGVYPDPSAVSNTDSYTLPDPNSTVNFVTVNVKLSINGVICYDQDILVLVLDAVIGCQDPLACDYNPLATVADDCCYLTSATYTCSGGLTIPVQCPDVSYEVLSFPSNIPFTNHMSLPFGTSTIIGMRGFAEVCRVTLEVPQCYNCVSGECVAAASNSNLGQYTTSTCNFACGCDLTIGIDQMPCSGNKSSLEVTVTGGSGEYTVDIMNSLSVVLFSAVTTSGIPVVSPADCNQEYIVKVTDNAGLPNACPPIHFDTNCFNCLNSVTALDLLPSDDETDTYVTYTCAPGSERFYFIIHPDPCAVSYTVEIRHNNDPDDAVTASFGNLLVPTASNVSWPAAPDGNYTVEIIDSNGCSRTYETSVNCGGTMPECNIVDFNGLWDILGDDLRLGYELTVDGAGVFSYDIQVFEGAPAGSCTTFSPAALPETIPPITVTVPAGSYVVPVFVTIPAPFDNTCYKLVISGNSPLPANCEASDIVSVVVLPPPTGCLVNSFNVSSYNTGSQGFTLTWNVSSSSGDITLRRTVWDTGVCGVGSSVTTDVDGLSPISFGHTVSIDQIDGVAQCVEFTLFDTDNPSCTSDVVERVIPACTCSVELTDVVYNTDLERLEIDWESSCASVPTGFTIEIIERSLAGCAGTTTLLTSYAVITESGTQYHSITAPGPDRYIQVVITDDVNAACTDDACVVITGCNDCTTQFVDIPASRVSSLEDSNANLYLMPAGVFFECVNIGDPSTVNDDAAAALEDHLVSLGDCGTPIVTWESLVTDTTTCMHSGITYGSLSGTGTLKYLGIDINGNLYSTDIAWANVVSGTVTLIPAAEDLIQDHVLDSLNTELIPFSEVQVSCTRPVSTTGAIEIMIAGIDITEVLEGHYDNTISGGTNTDPFDIIGCADLGEDGADGLCIRVTIADSGIVFATADVGNNTYTFDTSGC